jgi:ABC-type uncharacterized transport system involved in gliding motility auxiliary subunit
MLDPVLKRISRSPALQALLKDWGIEAGNDVVLDVSGMGRCSDGRIGAGRGSYPPHRDHGNFRC